MEQNAKKEPRAQKIHVKWYITYLKVPKVIIKDNYILDQTTDLVASVKECLSIEMIYTPDQSNKKIIITQLEQK